MKKIYFILIFLIFCMACGCSKTNSQSQNQKNNEDFNRQTQTQTTTLSSNQTQIVGKVTSIIGNEVVLALGEISSSSMPQPESNEANASNSENSSSGGTSSSENQNSRPSSKGAGQRPSGSEFSGGQMPSGEKPSGEMPSDGNFGGNAAKKIEITLNGETGTYIIPVGLSLSGISGNTTDFSAITQGMILRLTLETTSDNSQKIIAAEVLSQ